MSYLNGANLQSPPNRIDATNIAERQKCQLLFVGTDWQQKGGDIAFETMLELVKRGIDANLVVGCTPPTSHERITIYPFLNKQIPDQLATYQSLWRESAFLCQPTRGETFGAIYAEAAASGLPAITTNTGGVADAVAQGQSGFLLPMAARGNAYADTIQSIWQDQDEYRQLVISSRDRFDAVLNWNAWGDRIEHLINQFMSQKKLS